MDVAEALSLILPFLCMISLSTTQQIVTTVDQNEMRPDILLDPFLDDEEFRKEYPNIFSLKFHLKDEKLMDLFTRFALLDLDSPLSECEVTLADIIEATQIGRYNTEDIAEALVKLNIGADDAYNILLLYDITVPVMQNLLDTFSLTFSEIYNYFVKSLTNPVQTIPAVLTAVNVSVTDFTNAQAYGDDAERLRVLSTGNYSQQNLINVLNITGKTSLDMLKILPLNTTARQIRKLDSINFLNFVKNLGIASYNLQSFYRHLNITHINIITDSKIIKCLTAIYDSLNSEEALGVAISKYSLITSNKAKVLEAHKTQTGEIVRNYSKFSAELVENPLVQHAVKYVRYFNHEYQSRDIAVVETVTPFIANATQISKHFNTTKLFNCTYVSKLYFGGIYSENISEASMDQNKIKLAKSDQTIYNLGSPLFCQEKLYGIAVQNDTHHITFSTLMKISTGTSTKPGGPGNVTQPYLPGTEKSSGVTLSCSVVNFIFILATVIACF